MSPSIHWNYDGTLLTARDSAIAALGSVVGEKSAPLHGLDIRDVYSVVDGNQAMLLYTLKGVLANPLPGAPLGGVGAKYNALGAERFGFDSDALVDEVITVDQFGRIAGQVSGSDGLDTILSPPKGKNVQTTEGYRARVRGNLAALHRNVNAGRSEGNARMAVEDVIVNDNGVVVANGTKAFMDLVSSKTAGLGAFPEKKFHDFHVLVDGHFGAVEYVWQGQPSGPYPGVNETVSGTARMRGFMFFELNGEGLVTKVIGVYDEAVVGAQLGGKGGYLYP